MPKTVTKAELQAQIADQDIQIGTLTASRDKMIEAAAGAGRLAKARGDTIAALGVEVRRLFDLKDQKDETIRILRARIAELESREDRAWPGEVNAAIPPQSANWHPWR